MVLTPEQSIQPIDQALAFQQMKLAPHSLIHSFIQEKNALMQELFQSLRYSNKPNEPRPRFCNTYVLIYKSLLIGLIESWLSPAYLTACLI